jgi:ketosteroid isomerase-like protein
MAFSQGKYFLSLETPGGVIQDEGSYLEVWEKVEGEWKITADIYNTDLLPVGPGGVNGS